MVCLDTTELRRTVSAQLSCLEIQSLAIYHEPPNLETLNSIFLE